MPTKPIKRQKVHPSPKSSGEREPRKGSLYYIYRQVIQNEGISAEEVKKYLDRRGVKTKLSTVVSHRYLVLMMLRALRELGKLSDRSRSI